jgi:hypothetical protein
MFCKAIKAESLEEAIEKLKKSNIKDCLSVVPEYQIFVNGNKTMVVDKYGRRGVARCHPDDKFDIVKGFEQALYNLRITNKILLPEERELLLTAKYLGCEEIGKIDEFLMLYNKDRTIDLTLENDDRFSWLTEGNNYSIDDLLER